jgi:peptide/nickel transport system permease protein
MSTRSFLVRRVLSLLLVIFCVSVITFVIFVEIPGGDPAVRLAGRNPTAQNIANIRQEFGFDKPVYVQYVRMMEQAVTGRLISYQNYTNVTHEIVRGLPATLSLAITSGALWLLFGGLIGAVAALKAGRPPDTLLTGLALAGLSLPVFWLGIELRYLLAEKHSVFPDGGYVGLFADPLGWASHIVLPALVFSLTLIGVYGRVLRSNILDAMSEDHVFSARAKGLSRARVFGRHVLRNALIPVVSLFALDFAAALGGGTMLVEQVFDLHGVGQYTADAIGTLDLPVIMAVTLYFSTLVVLFGAAVELLYVKLDPRIRA